MEQSNQSEYTETFHQLCVLVIKSSCCYLNMVNLKILGHVILINTHLLTLSTHPKQPICRGGYGFMQISNPKSCRISDNVAAPPPNLAAVFSLGIVLTFLAHSSGCTQYPHGNTDHLISSSTCTISLNPTGNKATLSSQSGSTEAWFCPQHLYICSCFKRNFHHIKS